MRPDPKITPKFVVAVVEEAREIATQEAALRVPPRLVTAVVIAGVTLMSWGVIRSTWAQDAPKPVEPVPPRAAPKDPGPPPVQDSVKPAVTAAPPLAADAVPETSVPKLPDVEPSQLSPLPLQSKSSQLSEPPPAESAPPSGQNDDPEKTVQAFIEQNRKVAEGQLKNLKDEEAKLRARLQKVEGGIKRWEALLTALEKSTAGSSSKGLTLTDPRVPGSNTPHPIESAPPQNPVELPPIPSRDLEPASPSNSTPPIPR